MFNQLAKGLDQDRMDEEHLIHCSFVCHHRVSARAGFRVALEIYLQCGVALVLSPLCVVYIELSPLCGVALELSPLCRVELELSPLCGVELELFSLPLWYYIEIGKLDTHHGH
jgi:hypothetical protein